MRDREKLEQRIRDLAGEKSRYQMVSDILMRLASVRGLEDIIHQIIYTVMDAWGGSNVVLYHRLDEGWFISDIYREGEGIEGIEDPLILLALETGIFQEAPAMDGSMVLEGLPHIKSDLADWVFPLKRDEKIFGALKMEGVFLNKTEEVKSGLAVIVEYFSMVLQNEILNTGSLMEANRALKREIAERSEEQKRYRDTIEGSFDGFWIADRGGRFLEVNDIYCRMSGYSRDELLIMSLWDVESLESTERVEEHLKRCRETGRDRFETQHCCRDGRVIDVEVNSIYAEYKGGVFYAFLRDITEKKRAEEEKALLEERFRQAQKVESIGRLAGGVAHDLNNLLSPILGYSEIILAGLDDRDRRKGQMEQVRKASLKARDLVQQLLAFSRKQALEYSQVDLNGIVEGFRTLLRRTIREDIEFRFHLRSGAGRIMADRGQIEQVLMNLSVNAQDAMPDGGTLIFETDRIRIEDRTIGMKRELEPGDYAVLIISDTGSGMEKSLVDQIFEPFFSTKGEQGTGLGLATVYGIVKQHEGGIWVYSEPGRGTAFKIYLPVCKETEEQKPECEEPEPESEHPADGVVLLVEDDDQVRELAEEILVQEGFQVLSCSRGEEALALLDCKELGIDLMLTDVIMPGMNGKELYDRISARLPGLKAIFMSGYTSDVVSVKEVLEEGIGFIQKPFTIKSLISTVNSILNTRK